MPPSSSSGSTPRARPTSRRRGRSAIATRRRPLRAGAAAAAARVRDRPAGLPRLAAWAAAGLTAYDAAYVTVAEEAGVHVVTDDAGIVRAAPETAIALGAWAGLEAARDERLPQL